MLSFEAPDDTPSPSVVHKAAVAWAKTLEQGGYVGFQPTAVVLGGLGADVVQMLGLPPGLTIPLGSVLGGYLGQEITPYGLYRCGLWLWENADSLKKGVEPVSLERLSMSERKLMLVRVIRVMKGDVNIYGRRNWGLLLLLASSKMAGAEVNLTLPDRPARLLMSTVSGLVTSSGGYVEHLTGMWLKVALGRRPPAKGFCVIRSENISSVLNRERIAARKNCPRWPCHQCPLGLDRCKWSIKPISEGKEPENGS